MARSKAPLFGEKMYRLSLLHKALSHPARIVALQYLLEMDYASFSDILRIIPLSQPAVSSHLRLLRNLSLVYSIENPPNATYYLTETARSELIEWFELMHSAKDAHRQP